MTSRSHARTAAGLRRAEQRVRVADFVAELSARQTADGGRASAPEATDGHPATDDRRPRGLAADAAPPVLAPRPRIVEDPSILGLSRHARGRFGSKLFTWFFVLVYAVIVIQLVVALWQDT